MTTKTVKLQVGIRDSRDRSKRYVPVLHLSGHWLAHYGFQPGAAINVRIDYNVLTITPNSDPVTRSDK